MEVIEKLKGKIINGLENEFRIQLDPALIKLTRTNQEFSAIGDISFNFNGLRKIKTDESAGSLADRIIDVTNKAVATIDPAAPLISISDVTKGFINVKFSDKFWIDELNQLHVIETLDVPKPYLGRIVLEYCGPNTNKPLHIGHLRNMLLGYSMGEILKAVGYEVIKVNIYNDRGIAICKSMVAYRRFGKETDPNDYEVKGDKFVGDWYVKFNTESKIERDNFLQSVKDSIEQIVGGDAEARKAMLACVPRLNELVMLLTGSIESNKEFKDNPDLVLRRILIQLDDIKNEILGKTGSNMIVCRDCVTELQARIRSFLKTSIFSEAINELQKWEDGDPDTIALWEKMNSWVYQGFNETYKTLGVDFHKDYYESKTYKYGKEIVEDGLKKKVFYKRTDGTVVVDLKDEGLDEKVLLRSDGTALYITQDLATAVLRQHDFHMDKMVYVVADEQEYHFKVLKLTLAKLGYSWAKGIHHLSYALVESPTGRFKSREGKTADADDIIREVCRIAEERTKALGKVEGLSYSESQNLYKVIGLGALKYFILKVNPFKKMIFNPEESIDFQGNTGPFIQFNYARIRSVLRKSHLAKSTLDSSYRMHEHERAIIKHLCNFDDAVRTAANNYDPSKIAEYIYELSKLYGSFWHELSILNEEENKRQFRLAVTNLVGNTIAKGMKLLGIEVPERM